MQIDLHLINILRTFSTTLIINYALNQMSVLVQKLLTKKLIIRKKRIPNDLPFECVDTGARDRLESEDLV